ncbi:hypothetical protein BH11PLA2_BH11PLA2_08240 [soil metagenome]
MRRIVLLMLVVAGCKDLPMMSQKPPETRPASLAAAARVDQVGRQILAANPFTGLDVSFQVVGNPEPLLLHRDRFGVFISDSLVDQCKTDAELAAVLCTELAKLVAEQRSLTRMGYDTRSDVPMANSMGTNDLAGDPVRMAEGAIREQQSPRVNHEKVTKELTDPKAIAAELLKTSGHDVKNLETIEPLLKNLNKDRDLVKQLSGGSILPSWSR